MTDRETARKLAQSRAVITATVNHPNGETYDVVTIYATARGEILVRDSTAGVATLAGFFADAILWAEEVQS